MELVKVATIIGNSRKPKHIYLLGIAFLLLGCQQQPPQLIQLKGEGPLAGQAVPQPKENPATVEGVALGKALFFDTRLSRNGQVSCATCHLAEAALADTVAVRAIAGATEASFRNTPSLYNLASRTSYFWDGGVNSLERVMLAPIRSHAEMGGNVKRLDSLFQHNESYKRAFAMAFPKQQPDLLLAAYALAQYVRTLQAMNSRYDAYQAGKAQLSSDELAGWQLFQQHCINCHQPPLFAKDTFANIGVEVIPLGLGVSDARNGRFRISQDSSYVGAYRVPSLRDVALTPPYFHHGGIKTLRESVKIYSQQRANTRTLYRGENILPAMPLSEAQIDQLTAFLHTLTHEPAP